MKNIEWSLRDDYAVLFEFNLLSALMVFLNALGNVKYIMRFKKGSFDRLVERVHMEKALVLMVVDISNYKIKKQRGMFEAIIEEFEALAV